MVCISRKRSHSFRNAFIFIKNLSRYDNLRNSWFEINTVQLTVDKKSNIFYLGSLGQQIHLENIVDLRNMRNDELVMRISSYIRNLDRKFYTDTNGFHVSTYFMPFAAAQWCMMHADIVHTEFFCCWRVVGVRLLSLLNV